ncbi:DoxX family protein [Celeribacter sp. PS-C1]|uniref:DoxX family protein n=1 Tax=Celeribacter sp. PS-C1 TaxID=2820813 RepID=UPI001C66B52A|nr:DoxX family protein [Celeribacter sp. PS-C1]MBW6417012.1 DoxX family protein [Celeribacter sp. PS-C1]
MSDIFVPQRQRLILPALEKFYSAIAEPFGWAAFRVTIGLSLVVAGWPKIQAPLAQSGFVESLGISPGWLFSPMLAAMQFFGGFLIAFGLLTRPIALANAVMLLITLWFHMAHPYPEAFFTVEGLAYLQANPELLTSAAQSQLLADNGAMFGMRIQEKAIYASLFWAAGAALIAAFGGGYFSLDRKLKKEF